MASHVGDAVFALVPSALVLCDTGGGIVGANPAAGRLIGRAPQTLVGGTLTALFVDEGDRVHEALARWQRSSTPRPAGFGLAAGGETVPVQVAGARVPGTDTVLLRLQLRSEATRHFAYLSRDVEVRDLRELRSRLQATLEELSRSNRRLAATNEELESYASLISHDLRGPLSTIRQFAALLESGEDELGEESKEMLAAIDRLSEKAVGVAESLLRLARAGSFEGVSHPTDAGRALASASDQLGFEADGHALRSGGLPKALVHEAHLVQVFANLMSNSVRYRDPERPLEVEVSSTVGDGWATFVVADNGLGIQDGDRQRIFAPNVRGRNVSDDEGTGLGLALCRRIVAGYGGSIDLVDHDGPGATFAFTLPVADETVGTSA